MNQTMRKRVVLKRMKRETMPDKMITTKMSTTATPKDGGDLTKNQL